MIPKPTDVFTARAQARALLWQAGELHLHEAVDELEAFARHLKLDTDEAQALMAAAFGKVRPEPVDWHTVAARAWEHSDWEEAAIEYREGGK